MRSTKTAVAIIAMLVGLSATAFQPAEAQNFRDILNRLGGVSGSGLGFAPNQGMIQSNISTGLTNISSQISAGVSSGQLTFDEQSTVNMELSRVRMMNDSFLADGGYSNAEVQQILSAFSNLNSVIATHTANGINTGINTANSGFGYNIGNGGYGWSAPNLSNYNAVINLQNGVQARINQGLANGSLTTWEANSLRNDYANISAQLNRRNVRGNLNVNPVVRRLANLDRRLNQLMNDNNNRYADRGGWFY